MQKRCEHKKLNNATWSTYALMDTMRFTVAHNVITITLKNTSQSKHCFEKENDFASYRIRIVVLVMTTLEGNSV